MSGAVLLPLILQLLVPLALITWVASSRHPARLSWLLAVAAAAAWIGAVQVAGLWLVVPWYLPPVFALLLVLAVLRSSRRARERPLLPRGVLPVGVTVVAGLAAAVACTLLVRALAGRNRPGVAVALAAPLRGGPYLVANGGSNSLVSSHVMTLEAPRFRRWRGQSHGVDLVRIGPAGLRARGVLPRDPAAYRIFGDTIYAPCAGTVIGATDGLPDLPVPQADRVNLAGNHVLLGCDEAWVLLGHMGRGSVRVRADDRVHAGQPIGTVGNSGNTGEPHLHIHAQRPGTPAEPLAGEPLPITLGGRYLVRGQRVTW